MANALFLFERRKARTRAQIRKKGYGRPRLSVFRSGQQMYAQIIDDAKGVTLVSASTLDKDLKKDLKTGATASAAAQVGKLLAERALKAGLKDVIFDRGGYMYHGRVKALAEAAREGGLNF